jgi:hypothetical protein
MCRDLFKGFVTDAFDLKQALHVQETTVTLAKIDNAFGEHWPDTR